jgi:anaerobic dimethyl sulfoxide reductase subunit A
MDAKGCSFFCSKLAAFFESLESWREAAPELDVESALTQIEYDDLLKGTNAHIYVPLWTSCAKSGTKLLMSEVTLEVIKFYKACGWQPRYVDGNPPDYLGEELSFLAYLYGCRADDPGSFTDEPERFTDLYLGDTVKAFCEALENEAVKTWISAAGLAELAQLSDLLSAAVKEEIPEVSGSAGMPAPGAWRRKPAIPVEPVRKVRIANVNDCGSKCQMLATVQENCLLGTEPEKTFLPFTGCQRGRSYRYTFLTADRLRYPMVRRSERGEGLYRRVSWEEVEKMIADEIRSTKERFGPGARYVTNASGVSACARGDRFIRRLLGLDGGWLETRNGYSCTCVMDMMEITYGRMGGGSNDVYDLLNANLIILWGHNPAENHFGPFVNDSLAKCKEKGIPIVVIDPRVSETVLTLADEWIPIKPSSDGAMADAMCYVIWKNGLQDQAFMDRFCVGFDEEHMPEGVPAGESYYSYLFGKKDGIEKTPEWAEAICGVPAKTIEDLAIRYAKAKPGCLFSGLAPQRTGNGEQTARCFMALACLCGYVGVSGGNSAGTGWQANRTANPDVCEYENPYGLSIPSFLWTRAVMEPEIFSPEMQLWGGDKLDTGVKLVFSLANGQTLSQHSNINETIEMYKTPGKLEMLVFSNLFMTPAAYWADVVLPAASFLEQDNIVPSWDNNYYFLYNNHCIEPLFGWKFEHDWIKACADLLGCGDAFRAGKETTVDWLKHLYEKMAADFPDRPELKPFEEFQKNGIHVWKLPERNVSFEENIKDGVPFKTPSGKIEIFSKKLWDMNWKDVPAIPGFLDCYEGPRDPKQAEYPLQLIAYHTKRRAHSIHDNNVLMEELDPPRVWISKKDAAARGITDGDRVEVFNDRGVSRTTAFVTDRIMDGVIAMSEGVWYKPGKDGIDERGSINVLTHTVPTPYSRANPQHTNLADVRKYNG